MLAQNSTVFQHVSYKVVQKYLTVLEILIARRKLSCQNRFQMQIFHNLSIMISIFNFIIEKLTTFEMNFMIGGMELILKIQFNILSTMFQKNTED